MLEIGNSDREYGHGNELAGRSGLVLSILQEGHQGNKGLLALQLLQRNHENGLNENPRQHSRINTDDSPKSSISRPLSFLVRRNLVGVQSEQVPLLEESIE